MMYWNDILDEVFDRRRKQEKEMEHNLHLSRPRTLDPPLFL
jgi:hypothetical protein